MREGSAEVAQRGGVLGLIAVSVKQGQRARTANLPGIITSQPSQRLAVVDGFLEFGVLLRGIAEGVERGEGF